MNNPKFVVEDRVARISLAFAVILLALAGLFGLMQVLARAGLPLINAQTYYIGLTLHGVAAAVLWTAFFIVAVAVFVVTRELGVNMNGPLLLGGAVLAIVGTLMGAAAILSGQASVLYTFYPPMWASPLFFMGLAVVIVGTWLISAAVVEAYLRWRRANPGVEIPLGTFGVLVTIFIWLMATPPVAYAVLFQSLPMSLWGAPVDVLLWRLWFWYFGHPLVYFWLVPAVTIWYTILPRVLGVEVFSRAMAKAALVLYLVASVPVGLHHQFVDPGLHPVYKYIHTVLTYLVAVPSLLTAFNVVATLERAGRARGGRGLFGWIAALPWGRDPVFTGITLAIILFGIAGFSGVVNASYNVNYLVHNTSWVVGHFHLTVGGGVSLTFVATTFLLLPLLFGREYLGKRLLVAVPLLWFVGQLIFGLAYHVAGLYGVPRRTYEFPYLGQPGVNYIDAWGPLMQLGAAGAALFVAGGALYVLMTLASMAAGPRVAMNGAEVKLSPPPGKAGLLDRLGLWLAVAIALILVAYSLPVAQIYGQGLSPAPPYNPVTGAPA